MSASTPFRTLVDDRRQVRNRHLLPSRLRCRDVGSEWRVGRQHIMGGIAVARFCVALHAAVMDDLTNQADSNMRKRLLRLMMTALDFRHSLSAATFLLEDWDGSKSNDTKELRRLKCYETTMVVAYGRPFAQAKGAIAPFSWKQIKPGFQIKPDEVEIHNRLIEHRNKLHAHSDGNFTQIRPEIWRSKMPSGPDHDFLAILGGESLVFSEVEVNAIHKFLWKVRHHVDMAVQSHPASRDGIPVMMTNLFDDAD